MFCNIFTSLPNGQTELDGMSDKKPIYLDGLSQETFKLFLEYTFGRMHTGPYSTDELSKFLHFCDMYQCRHAQQSVMHRIFCSRFNFHPAQLINLAIKYHVHSIFPFAFKELVETSITEITCTHWELMGQEVFLNIVYVQAALNHHRQLVAAEEPKILMHSDDCQDPTGCSEDWHAIWWNGMGRFLLDARNPQPYSDAVKCFKELKFGRVSGGCKELMFKSLDQGAAFRHAEHFFSEASRVLVEKLIFEP
ncbi:hypothetical protein BDR04DRAFT_1069167 [Suillus decipiens]|nr:hypothetical protein BDR04DRAFT_1069167 [Suillus decipiens]